MIPIRIYCVQALLAACVASIVPYMCYDICGVWYDCLLCCLIVIGMLVFVVDFV